MRLISSKTYIYYSVVNKTDNKIKVVNCIDVQKMTTIYYNEPIDYLSNEKHYFDIMPKRIFLN